MKNNKNGILDMIIGWLFVNCLVIIFTEKFENIYSMFRNFGGTIAEESFKMIFYVTFGIIGLLWSIDNYVIYFRKERKEEL